jgi:hypothetical protein
VWLSGFNAVIATFRVAGVLGSMWAWGFTPIVVFWHQLAVADLFGREFFRPSLERRNQ